MVRTGACMVPQCPSRFDLPALKRTMSYFQIPDPRKNPSKMKLAKKWLAFCGLSVTGFAFGNRKYIICEKHFLPEHLEILEQRNGWPNTSGYISKRVRKGAVPKIFDIRDAPRSPSFGANTEGESTRDRDSETNTDNLKGEDSRYVNDFVPEPLDKPPTVERKQAADLARWPPNLKIPVSSLNAVLTCGICNDYFYNATTITECLHTFCKGCLVTHLHASLFCPICEILVHPSDPFVNIKSDAILQDLVYKIFPQRLRIDQKDERDFYISQGLKPPVQKSGKTSHEQCSTKKVRMISVRLDYAGTTPSLPPHQPLEKNFIRIPNNVTVGQIAKFLHLKMDLLLGCQAALFVNCFMLNESLAVSRLKEIFGDQIHEQSGDDMVFLQYGVIPRADYFDKGLLISTKYL